MKHFCISLKNIPLSEGPQYHHKVWWYSKKDSEDLACGQMNGYDLLQFKKTLGVAQMVKNLPAMWKTWVSSLGLEKGMTAHSTILAWRIPWMEEPAVYSPLGCKEPDTTDRLTRSFIFFLRKNTWIDIWEKPDTSFRSSLQCSQHTGSSDSSMMSCDKCEMLSTSEPS